MKIITIRLEYFFIFIFCMFLMFSCDDKPVNQDYNNLIKPTIIDGTNVYVYQDLKYGESASQRINIAFPDNPENIKEKVNAILFIHGGGWQEGDKNVYDQAIVDNSKNLNYVVAAMNYRMFGEGADCDDMLEDIKNTLNLMKSFSENKGVYINKVLLMGASAGGHLSLLYSYKNHKISPIPIALCIGQSSPTDFSDPELISNPLFGNYMLDCISKLTGEKITIDNYAEKTEILLSVSPINYIEKGIPPTLISHGANDVLVTLSNAYRLEEKLNDGNYDAALFVYPNSGHELDSDPEVNEAFFWKMLEYINKYLN